MNSLRKWMFSVGVITMAFSMSTCGNGGVSNVSGTEHFTPTSTIENKIETPTNAYSTKESEIVTPTVAKPTIEVNTVVPTSINVSSISDVIQNNAFAIMNVVDGSASLTAGFTHPDNLDEEVMIEWFLYAWNQNEDPVQLQGNLREIAINHVEINVQLPVQFYDYYLFECKNKLKDESGVWVPFFTSQSRFSRIAPFNGIWERTGEVTSSSAVLHTYLTELPPFDATEPENLSVPPMAGFAQFHVYNDPSLAEENKVALSGFYPVDDYIQVNGEWRRVNYNFRWTVSDLEAGTQYYYVLETMSSDGLSTRIASNTNTFRTAPLVDAVQPITFVIANCLDPYNTAYINPLESATRGLKVFASMLNFADQPPDFVIMQGDTVYYDGGDSYAPDVGDYLNSEFIRRWLYWYAQYQFENLMYFYQQVPGYWQVDDHDYWTNNINSQVPDGWYIFRNVNPTPGGYGTLGEDAVNYYSDNPFGTSQGDGSKYWRAIRWGQHLEIFIEEGRNYRDEDAGLIWGDEQRVWLEQKILESDATFKIVVTTTPLIGPLVSDDFGPGLVPDKHANDKFRSETELFLNNIRDAENVYFVVGDRHYKYHSIVNSDNFPELPQFNEFSPGSAAAPPHAVIGGVPDSDLAKMVFSDVDSELGASAGYLRIELIPFENNEEITFKLIGVTDEFDNEVIHQATFSSSEMVVTYLPMVVVH